MQLDGRSAVRHLFRASLWLASVALWCAFFSPAPARANTSIFANAGNACGNTAATWCQNLSVFGVLTGVNDSVTFNGAETVGNGFGIGINSGGKFNITGTSTMSSTAPIDFSDATITRSGTAPCTGTNDLCGNGTININGTGYHPNSSPLLPVTTNAGVINNTTNGANVQFNHIVSYLGTLTSSTPFSVGANGTATTTKINVQGAGYDSVNNRTIYNATNYSQAGILQLGCGGVTCNANDMVFVLLNGTSATFNYDIKLADGLTADQVIYYVPNIAQAVSAAITPTAAAITITGDFFFKNAADTITFGATKKAQPITLVGRVYGPSITFNSIGTTMSDDGIYTPEPGTWALWLGGLGGLVCWGRRRRRSEK